MSVTIYHNPDCGTSRNTLAMIRSTGVEPRVIEYLKTPPSRDEIRQLVQAMGVPLVTVMRRKGTPFDELGLGADGLPEDALLDAIAAHPILLNRPIVATPLGVKLCRPSELVFDLLDGPRPAVFVKEDGERVVPSA
ncbi:arsenate reductase [Aliidongia dinghuensis]|uniref:Arsenate reductase n=1 Tax=Aliidongia dinghuensis TaxID=1867774 RepID=A0A8J3E6Z6_9PROT|nr:arsenate reductase (glutaredoxin) [Aliidongia dinghuensis]GGF33887.1 arsenate reductase [Aliidongia dinghuensis]